MVRAVTIRKCMTFALTPALTVALSFSVGSLTASAQDRTYPLSYSGRLTLPGGEPMQGPVDIELKFWDAATDGAALSRPFRTAGATLNQGVFQLRIPMTDAEVSEVFGDGTKTVYVEIIAKDLKYPRQEFTYVPLALTALRVPIDNRTLKYGTDGKLKVEVPARPSSDSVLVIDGQGKFNWEPFTAAQNGSGSTSIKITAGLGLSGGTITNAGTISLAPTGVTAGTYARAQLVIDNTGRVTSATDGGAIDLAADVSGTLSVTKGGTGATSLAANSLLVGNDSAAIQTIAPSTAGNILTSNGSAWVSSAAPVASVSTSGYLSASDWAAFSQKQAAGAYLTGFGGDVTSSAYSSGTATTTLASVSIPGTATKISYDAKGRVLSGTSLTDTDIPPLSAAIITSGTFAVARGGTGSDLSTTGGTGQYLKQSAQGGAVTVGTIPASDITQSLGYTPLNKAGDTLGGALNGGSFDLSNVGNIQMVASKTLSLGTHATDPTGLTAGDIGKTWFNSTSAQIKYWNGSAAVALGVAGSGLSSLNGQTGNTQSFPTPGTTGTSPNWVFGTDTHTLNIPLASSASVTAGLLSNSDYTAFSNKVSSVTQGSGIAVSSASGTATVSLATAGTAGNYTKVTTDTYGRVTSGNTLTDADLPPHSAGLINAGTLNVANGGTGATTLTANSVILGNGIAPVQTVAPGTSGNVLTSNGTTWQSTALPASVASVSGTSPITVTGTTAPVVSMSQANASTNGYLSSTDWSTFNTKQASGNYIAQLDGDVTLSSYASGTATANLASISLAGTSTKVTYDVKGRITSGTTLTASDIPTLTTNQITTSLGYTPLNRTGDSMTGALSMGGSDITNTGNLQMAASSEVRFAEATANGTNYVGFKAPSVISADKVWVLPATDGSAGQVLKTDGAGNLGWVSAAILANDIAAVENLATTGGVERTATDTWSTYTLTSAGKALLDDVDATAQRTTLGLGSLATASAVAGGSGGTITDASITDDDIASAANINDAKLATISTAGKVSGSAITSGTIGGSTGITTSGNLITTGNIGIGTANPAGKLDVAGTICLSGTNCISSWPTGSVTSVSAGTGLTGGPVTSSGTLSLANTAVTPGSYSRANITVDAQGRLTAASNGTNVALTTEVTGTLPVANGGTGATTLAANSVLLGNGTSAPLTVAPGINGNVLTSNGTTWVSAAPASGGWTVSGSDVYRGSGNVGIGSASPGQRLSVAGTIESTTGGIKFPDGTVQTTSAVGGSNNSMVSGWPDALACNQLNAASATKVLLWPNNLNDGSGQATYLQTGNSSYGLRFNYSTGAYIGIFGWSAGTLDCEGNSIAQQYSNGSAFNFAKGPAGQWLQTGAHAYYNAGNVGIGTAAPTAALETSSSVAGAVATGLYLRNGAADTAGNGVGISFGTSLSSGVGQAQINALRAGSGGQGDLAFFTYSGAMSEKMRVTNGGNIGIGTTNPAGKLDVAGSICLNGANCITSWPSGGSGNWATTGSDSYLASGKLGLGTSSPAADLSFGGTVSRTIQVDRNTGAGTNGGGLTLQAGGAISGGSNYNGGTLTLASGVATGTGTSAIEFRTASAGASGATDAAPTTKMTILGNGNVGIGTTAPTGKLEVGDTTAGAATEIVISNTVTNNSTATLALRFAHGHSSGGSPTGGKIVSSREGAYSGSTPSWDSNLAFYTAADRVDVERMRITSVGTVGVGTTTPVTKVQVNNKIVHDNGRSYDSNALMVVHPTPTSTATLNDNKPVLYLGREGTDGQAYGAMANFGLSRYEASGTNSRTRLDLNLTHGPFNDVAVATFLSSGNVGIGTTNPTAKLQVDGEVKVGSSGSPCAAGTEGQVRYNTTLKRIEYCDGLVWQSGGHSAGEVTAFAGSTCPNGWLAANGGTASRTIYASLYSAIGTTYGTGDNSTTFTLPDMRGEFIRGYDNGRGIDSGRVLGSNQISTQIVVDDDQYQTVGAIDWGNNNLPNLGYETAQASGVNLHYATSSSGASAVGSQFARSIRPRNVALLYCIKY